MDALDAINNRMDYLENKLGRPEFENDQQGDSITANLAAAAHCVCAATAGHEKLVSASQRASELNNYIDPRYTDRLQESEAQAAAVASAAPLYEHHCHCMHQCQKVAPVLSSEAIQTAATFEPELQRIKERAYHDQHLVDEVSRGISDVVSQCGEAASVANEQVAAVARKLDDAASVKSHTSARAGPPTIVKKRNGLD